jgi:large subunit ribosomal protein L18e
MFIVVSLYHAFACNDRACLAQSPLGSNAVLLRGPRANREACKYWGAAGVPGSTTKPKVAHNAKKGRKVEAARGRRASRGFRV